MKKMTGCMLAVIALALIGAGIYMKSKAAVAVSIIGGADGPTSIFLAGKVPVIGGTVILTAGVVVLAAIAVVVILRRRKK
ncbi:MAG: oxaloacetate decarboxylase [bacterium]|nr:oxaloacetate decarboxylase [bacterium]